MSYQPEGSWERILNLTDQDIETIAFAGGRYAWSDALRGFEAGHHAISENEAWVIGEAFEEDTEGGHSLFPMLDPDSDLYEKLLGFWQEII